MPRAQVPLTEKLVTKFMNSIERFQEGDLVEWDRSPGVVTEWSRSTTLPSTSPTQSPANPPSRWAQCFLTPYLDQDAVDNVVKGALEVARTERTKAA